jgi:hypothetical protein
MLESLQLWLAAPEAAQHFDPTELTDDERDRLARLRRAARREEFQVSRALRAHARQCVRHPFSESMTHSGGHAALALVHPATVRVGVDLELHRPRDMLAAARAVFTSSEVRSLGATADAERAQLFYAIWTVKEALAKVLQLPLMEALRSCEVVIDEPQWQVKAPLSAPGGVVVYQPRAALTLAAAWIGARLPIETWSWPPQQRASWPLIAAISL